jgi:hypothetical protein
MNNLIKFTLACLLVPTLVSAAEPRLKIPTFASLTSKACDSVNISVNPWLLRSAAMLINDSDPDSVASKQMLAGIKSIEIRSYKFLNDFAYSSEDVDAVRRQLSSPGWSQLMQVRDQKQHENLDIYVLVENDQTTGFALIESDARAFTIISIEGSININDLPKLQKQLHLPALAIGTIS